MKTEGLNFFQFQVFWWNKLFFIPLAFEPYIMEKRKKYLKRPFPLCWGFFVILLVGSLLVFKFFSISPRKSVTPQTDAAPIPTVTPDNTQI